MALNNIESSMKLMHLSLLLVTLIFQMCSGVLLDISGSSEFAVLSKPFTLTCTARDAANIEGFVTFYRVPHPGSYGALLQHPNSCEEMGNPKGGGTLSCGIGTNRSSSTTKKYLVQFNVTDSNLTFCFCAFRNNLVSNNFTLQVKGKVHVNSAAEPPITDPFTLPIVFTVAQLVIGVLPTFL